MKKEKLESLIIDYIDNKLDPADRHTIEQELVANPEAYKLFEELKEVMRLMDRASSLQPSLSSRAGFDDMLKNERASLKKGRTVFLPSTFYRAAAAVALLVIGGGIGFWISRQNDQEARILAMEKEITRTKTLMMAMLENDQSASKRIQGINVAFDIRKADDEVVNALVKTMNEDTNSNVRLAALEALSRFKSEAGVRKALISSLSIQKDPVVQIALIRLLVEMKEKSVVDDLQRIVDDEESLRPVKDEAYSGLLKLS